MRDNLQDIIGNICMILAMIIVAKTATRKRGFWIRIMFSLGGLSIYRMLFFDVIGQYIANDTFRIYNMAGFILLFILMIVIVLICYKCNIWVALFYANVSYSLQHITQRLYAATTANWSPGVSEAANFLVYVGIVTLSLVLVKVYFSRLQVGKIVVDHKNLVLVSVIMVVSAVVLDITFLHALRIGGETLRLCMRISSILISFLTILLQFSMVVGKRKELELETIKGILSEERQQYYFEKSMIDLLNIKCHDIKHQIAALEPYDQNRILSDTKEAIDLYDSSFHTGNVALDVVLARKSFDCRSKNILITCAANGESLEFIQEVDIYSLFGNILDNAIEAIDKLTDDQDKRIISLYVNKKNNFVNIHSENYFKDKFVIMEGLPKTTKKDTGYHGFGLKSIKMLVEKYGGSLKIGTNEDRFVMDIVFPL